MEHPGRGFAAACVYYIAETMNLNALQKNALSELTDDALVDIMESFDEKPKVTARSYLTLLCGDPCWYW